MSVIQRLKLGPLSFLLLKTRQDFLQVQLCISMALSLHEQRNEMFDILEEGVLGVSPDGFQSRTAIERILLILKEHLLQLQLAVQGECQALLKICQFLDGGNLLMHDAGQVEGEIVVDLWEGCCQSGCVDGCLERPEQFDSVKRFEILGTTLSLWLDLNVKNAIHVFKGQRHDG